MKKAQETGRVCGYSSLTFEGSADAMNGGMSDGFWRRMVCVMGFVFVWRVEREKNEGLILGTMYSTPSTSRRVGCRIYE